MKDTRIRLFGVVGDYPFSKYKKFDIVKPRFKDVGEMEKFPQIFKDVTVQYKITRRNKAKEPIQVKRLRDGVFFNVGDVVWYELNDIKNTLFFTITGFATFYDDRDIYLCFNSKIHDNIKARAIGINKAERLLDRDETKVYEELS